MASVPAGTQGERGGPCALGALGPSRQAQLSHSPPRLFCVVQCFNQF